MKLKQLLSIHDFTTFSGDFVLTTCQKLIRLLLILSVSVLTEITRSVTNQMYSFILMERCCGYHLRFIRQVTKIFIIQPEPYILYIKGFDTTTTFCCYVHRIIVFYETTSLHRSYVINLRQSLASILSFILKKLIIV